MYVPDKSNFHAFKTQKYIHAVMTNLAGGNKMLASRKNHKLITVAVFSLVLPHLIRFFLSKQ